MMLRRLNQKFLVFKILVEAGDLKKQWESDFFLLLDTRYIRTVEWARSRATKAQYMEMEVRKPATVNLD